MKMLKNIFVKQVISEGFYKEEKITENDMQEWLDGDTDPWYRIMNDEQIIYESPFTDWKWFGRWWGQKKKRWFKKKPSLSSVRDHNNRINLSQEQDVQSYYTNFGWFKEIIILKKKTQSCKQLRIENFYSPFQSTSHQ